MSFGMNRDSNPRFGFGSVQQPGVAARLMMDVETSFEQGANDLLRLEDRQLLSHGGSGESHGYMFRRRLNISGDGLACHDSALEKAADRILCHLACCLDGFSERTDFGNGRNENAIAAFWQRLQDYRVKVLMGLALA